MVKLKNIKKNNDIVSLNYCVDDAEKKLGYIEYDVEQKKVVVHKSSEYEKDESYRYGYSKALEAIEIMAEANDYPEKFSYYWY